MRISHGGRGVLVLAAGLVLGGAACNQGGDDARGSGGSGNGASGGSGAGGNSGSGNAGSGANGGSDVGTPGCAPTTTCVGPCEDQACFDACVAQATPHGQELFDALFRCGTEAECTSFDCTVQTCPDEWDACANDYGENGYVCLASGKYESCDAGGFCTTRDVIGGAWGPTEALSGASAEAGCTTQMTDLILIASINDTQAGVQELCASTTCTRE